MIGSINRNLDLTAINIPIFNRAKLFTYKLQNDEALTQMGQSSFSQWFSEWKCIVSQFNQAPPIKIPGCFGTWKSSYDLCIFSDASIKYLAYVVCLKNNDTGLISFLTP